VDVLDAEPRSTAIGPLRTVHRRQYALRAHPADALQVVEQLALFRRQLSGRRQMLQGASAAYPEVRASRHDAIRRSDQDIDQTGLVQLAAPLLHAKANAFTGQSAIYEYGLAIDPCNPAPVVGEIHDVGFLDVAGVQLAGHAAANSLRCPAADSFKYLRTRATSWECSVAFRCPRSSSKRK
jgi:hypothetical protein